ncbi:hypothetical protein JB92DRAFT_2840493 [Gautieria morchelliformis]|nr:hypothetical protein JB92DRAFT_2840488 [Gautieria morchelliformis]KAF8532706.1 hypothetical protein JB92DRAFT_2840493 [Gautieria morchelliformis]
MQHTNYQAHHFLNSSLVNTQHSSMGPLDVHYGYQPLEELYTLLITNKAPNILQGIGMLHLLRSNVVWVCAGGCSCEVFYLFILFYFLYPIYCLLGHGPM